MDWLSTSKYFLNIIFVRDEHTYGKKMAGNGRKIVISNQTIIENRNTFPESISTHCVWPSYTVRPKQEDTCLPIKSSRGHPPDYFTDPFFAKINYCGNQISESTFIDSWKKGYFRLELYQSNFCSSI